MAGSFNLDIAMTGLFLMYAFVTGIFTVLLTVYAATVYLLYKYYRKHGQTRRQAILSTWRMWDE